MTNGNVFRKKIREVMQSYEDDLRRKKQFVHKEALNPQLLKGKYVEKKSGPSWRTTLILY
jgi:hypothetical protein